MWVVAEEIFPYYRFFHDGIDGDYVEGSDSVFLVC